MSGIPGSEMKSYYPQGDEMKYRLALTSTGVACSGNKYAVMQASDNFGIPPRSMQVALSRVAHPATTGPVTIHSDGLVFTLEGF